MLGILGVETSQKVIGSFTLASEGSHMNSSDTDGRESETMKEAH